MRKLNRKTIEKVTLTILSFAMFFGIAACTPAPDEVIDVYVEYEPNARGGIDKDAALEHTVKARIAMMLEEIDAVSSAQVDIGALRLSSFFLYRRLALSAKSPYTGVARPKPPATARICPVV